MIVLLGDLLLDLFAHPLGTTVERATSFAPRQGGAIANVAAVLGRCGVRCRMLASVGRDAHGDRLIGELREAGVEVQGVVRGVGATGVVFVQVDASGERSFVGYGGGAERSLSLSLLRAAVADPLADARWLHVSSGAAEGGELTETAWALIDEAQGRGAALSVDLNIRRHKWPDPERMLAEVRRLAARAALVRASEDDLRALGLSPSLGALAALAPAAVAVLSRGPRGADVRAGGVEARTAALEVPVVETTGAGDAFTAGVLAALVSLDARPGEGGFHGAALWQRALRAGHALGARAVGACGSTEAFRSGVDLRTLLG